MINTKIIKCVDIRASKNCAEGLCSSSKKKTCCCYCTKLDTCGKECNHVFAITSIERLLHKVGGLKIEVKKDKEEHERY